MINLYEKLENKNKMNIQQLFNFNMIEYIFKNDEEFITQIIYKSYISKYIIDEYIFNKMIKHNTLLKYINIGIIDKEYINS